MAQGTRWEYRITTLAEPVESLLLCSIGEDPGTRSDRRREDRPRLVPVGALIARHHATVAFG